MLSVVIPVRCTVQTPYIFERLEALLAGWDTCKDYLELFVADSGSHDQYREQIRALCENKPNVTYAYHDSHGEIFSIGATRDFAAQRAKMPFVMFQDADLVLKDGMYERIIEEIKGRGMDTAVNDFFLLPCVYLTEDGSRRFLENPDYAALERSYFNGDEGMVHSLAPSTSTWVINRHYYLSLGGHRREFYGHGCEDFEFLHRLCSNLGRFERPRDYYVDKKDYKSLEYSGFRAWFAAHGLPMFYRGFYSVHIWHPRQVMTGYDTQRARNQELLKEFMQGFDANKNYPDALADLHSKDKTLFLGVEGDRSWECVRQAIPLLGEAVYRRPMDFAGIEQFEQFVHEHGITRLFMFNPYGNEQRLRIYRWACENKFPYVVFERGGLPDSWFFDDKGFNADSASYAAALWDRPLSRDEDDRTTRYIDELLCSGQTLEKNGERCGADVLRRRLGIKRKQKVLFVPFQRPRDTVIRYFSGSVSDMDDFVSRVQSLAEQLKDRGWVVVAKKHPLETAMAQMPDVVMLPDDTHVYDALTLCNAVLLINSGVGLLASLFRKPVLHFGEIYYGHPKINHRVHNVNGVLDALDRGLVVDFDFVKRLIRYLREDFYSFGSALTEQRAHRDGSNDTVTLSVNFEQINLLGKRHTFALATKEVTWNAPAYAGYLMDLHHQRRKGASAAAAQRTGASKTGGTVAARVPVADTQMPFRLHPPRDKIVLRKLRKLIRDPKRFFSDSALVRPFAKVS